MFRNGSVLKSLYCGIGGVAIGAMVFILLFARASFVCPVFIRILFHILCPRGQVGERSNRDPRRSHYYRFRTQYVVLIPLFFKGGKGTVCQRQIEEPTGRDQGVIRSEGINDTRVIWSGLRLFCIEGSWNVANLYYFVKYGCAPTLYPKNKKECSCKRDTSSERDSDSDARITRWDSFYHARASGIATKCRPTKGARCNEYYAPFYQDRYGKL